MAQQWGLAVAGCAVLLGLAGQAAAANRPSIAVAAFDQAGVSADTLARAKSEVARIYGEAGIDVIWMDHGAVKPAGTFAIRLVVRPRAGIAPGFVMGKAFADGHETGGSAFVFYERVLRSAHEGQQDVACVLASGMAHEMGHLLLPYPAHSPLGIMRPVWDVGDLRRIADGRLLFAPDQAAALRLKASTCCPTATQEDPQRR
jgi:hypothetical protein